jgi:hypothetical protein
MHSKLLKDKPKLKPEAVAELEALVAKINIKRTARAWVYKDRQPDL